MPAFEYTALNKRGREEKGVLEADSMRQVRALLRERGLAPLGVAASREKKERSNPLARLFTPGLSIRELALVTRQLATLIGAGLPVEEALLAVSRQSENPRMEGMLISVRSKVLEGYSLAISLADFPRAFPELYRATVSAGESAGHLNLVLNRLADYTETRQVSRQKVQQAMVYPVILFVLTIAILAGLLGYVVPDIVKVFSDTGQDLPFLTTLIIRMSDFVRDWWIVVLVLIGLLLVRSAVHPNPLLDLSLFRIRSFWSAGVGQIFFTSAFIASILFHTLTLQELWGWSVLAAGFGVVVGPALSAVLGGPVGVIVDRVGHRNILVLGSLMAAVNGIWLRSTVTLESSWTTTILPAHLFLGVGVACSFATFSSLGLRDVPPARFATASATQRTLGSIGFASGIAISIAVFSSARHHGPLVAHHRVWVLLSTVFAAGALFCAVACPGRATGDSVRWPGRERPAGPRGHGG